MLSDHTARELVVDDSVAETTELTMNAKLSEIKINAEQNETILGNNTSQKSEMRNFEPV